MSEKRINSLGTWAFGAGIFNIVVAFPLAVPFLDKKFYALLNLLNHILGLRGRDVLPPADGANMLFVNTAGLALCLVGMMLIYASFDIKNRIMIPFLNALVRIVFPFLVIYYVLSENIARIALAFAAIDVIIASGIMYYTFFSKYAGKRTS